jgi:hypothetical protein
MRARWLSESFSPTVEDFGRRYKKLGDACEYFSGVSARNYPQAGRENLELAADRCRINVMQIILMTLVPTK